MKIVSELFAGGFFRGDGVCPVNQICLLAKVMIIIALGCQASVGMSQGEEVRLPATKDNSIVMVNGEWDLNGGDQSRIRIKGNQHMVVLGFDTTTIRGRVIKRAELVCHSASEKISGVTISTLATDWDEQLSTGMTAGVEGMEGWGYSGARFPAVTGGNAFTLTYSIRSGNDAENKAEKDQGIYHWPIPTDFVYALATGVSHGLVIHEFDADYARNPTIYSREQSSKAPYLLVEFADGTFPTPGEASEMSLIGMTADEAELLLRAPSQGFAYQVHVNGHPLARHNVPLVRPGNLQTIPLRDLPDSVREASNHVVDVVVFNRAGDSSDSRQVEGRLFQSKSSVIPPVELKRAPVKPIEGVAVIPVVDKYDEQGGAVGSLPSDYRHNNTIFDGQTLRMAALPGEIIGFQILLRGKESVELMIDGAPDWRIDFFQALYVESNGRKIPDPLVPLSSPLPLHIDRDRAVFVDLYVPFDAEPGRVQSLLKISDGRQIAMELDILSVPLPRKASFLCEMNSYGLPDHVEQFYALQQVAYDHRVHANILHYSHHTAAPGARKSNLDMRLNDGRRMDNRRYDAVEEGAREGYWDDFVTAFGSYLDGSYFASGHRGAIPAPGFYLTFHESWPLNCRAYFNGDPDAYEAFKESPGYAKTFENLLADFSRVAEQQGWNNTGFQVYFNNKGSLEELTKAPWILDEPASYWDYRALQYYGEMTDRGRDAGTQVQVDYRIDISRPEYCRGMLSGRNDLWVVSSSAFENYSRLVLDRIRRENLKVWVYGTTNPVGVSNRQTMAWALEAWKNGAHGVVPWQTVDKTGKSLSVADTQGLFIFDRTSDGEIKIRHSMRLKAYREAEQLIEVLTLVKSRRNWSDEQLRSVIEGWVQLQGQTRKVNDADAGQTEYGKVSLLELQTLRAAALHWLSMTQ
jgi:hypothetical protein